MEAEPRSRATHYLQELASVAVCQWHTDQQWTVIMEWETMLGNATGRLIVQESPGSQLDRERERSESLRVQLDQERKKSEILVQHVGDLEAKIKSLSPSVFEFGASGGGKFGENSIEKELNPEVQQNDLQPQFESLEKLAVKLKADIAEERNAALEQATAALNVEHSEKLEILQEKMQSTLSDKDIAFGKLQMKLAQAENLLGEKNENLTVLQRQLEEVEGVREDLALEKSRLEGELWAQQKQHSSQKTQISSFRADLLELKELLSRTLAASDNMTTEKPPHFEAKSPSFRSQHEGESRGKNDQKPFWGRLSVMNRFGKKNKLSSRVEQGTQARYDNHELGK